jgi:hypothetical protein
LASVIAIAPAAIGDNTELDVLTGATDLTAGDADPEGTEDLALRWLPFDEVLEMTLDGRIRDAMTIIAVERLALVRRLEQ